MILTSIQLADVRNYESLEFSPPPGLNVLLGKNAQGKSNLLEAIAMLSTGKSFRTSRESEFIRSGQPQATIVGETRVAAGVVNLACSLTATPRGVRKEYTVNQERVRYTSFLGRARVVTCTPIDLQVIEGAPALRRTMVNTALAQENPTYYQALSEYSRVLMQKNALLRGCIALDQSLLATYDNRLVEFGTSLMLERHRYVTAVAKVADSVAGSWVDPSLEGPLELTYRANVTFDMATTEGIRNAFIKQLDRQRPFERIRAQALVGPHRDDIHFTLGGRSLAAFGSQGQRRTALLAFKIGEYTVMRNRAGEAPLLLLDDVLSELDAQRQTAFLRALGTVEQAFITSAGDMPCATISSAYHIDTARLKKLS